MGYPMFQFPNLLNATRKRKINPYTGLEEPDYTQPQDMMVNQGEPTAQPSNTGGGKMAMFGRIMEALASGASIGLSNDPAKALQQQLSQQAQEAMQRQQMKHEQEKQEKQYRQQLELQSRETKANVDSLSQKQKFESEQATIGRGFEVEQTDKKFAQQKDLAQIDITARTSAQQLAREWEATEGLKNRQHQVDMEKLKTTGDIKQMEIRQVASALLASTKYHQAAPIAKVMSIIDKMNKDLPLDKEDFITIDNARKLQARSISGSGGSSSGSSSGGQTTKNATVQTKSELKTNEAYENDRAELVKSIILQGKQPMVDSNGNIKTDFSGKPIFQYATADELAKRVQEGVALFDSVRPQPTQQPTKQIQPNVQDQSQIILSNIDKAIQQGVPDNDIEQAISQLPSPQLQEQARARLAQKKKKVVTSSKYKNPALFIPKF